MNTSSFIPILAIAIGIFLIGGNISCVHTFSTPTPFTGVRQQQYKHRPTLTTTSLQYTTLEDQIFEADIPSFNETVSSTGGDTSFIGVDSISDLSQQQQLQQVLSTPELLDPAAILDNIGITNEDNNINNVAKDISKEDDIDLTRQTILDYIDYVEQVSDGNAILLGDEESDISASSLDVEEISSSLQSVDQQQEESSARIQLLKDNTPSVKKILRFTLPAIGIWLCSPVLSMIDTASVGLLSGTAQQAALNPAVSLTENAALLVAFMYTATTNLIAAAVQEDASDESSIGQPRTTKTLITSLKLALVVGLVFASILGASSKSLLKILISNESIDPVVFTAALRYVRIRTLGMPAMAVLGSAQSASLGMQDVKSPLYVLAAAAVVNFFGDVLLVPQASSWLGGAAGAAWATVFSQYAALLFFARWLTTRPATSKDNNQDSSPAEVVNITQSIMELTGTTKEGRSRRKEFRQFLSSSKLSKRIRRASSKFKYLENPESVALPESNTDNKVKKQPPKMCGFLCDKISLRSYLSISTVNKSVAKRFLPFIIPVTTTSIGRVSGYLAMAHVASSTLGTFDMAAHQIVTSIFFCLAPFVDALGQVAQSFVPAVFEVKEKSPERAKALRKTVNNFRKVGAMFSALLVTLTACIPLMSRYFTADPIVLQRVSGAIPGVGLFLLVNGLMTVGEGSLLGQKDLKFLRNMYAIFFFAVPTYMLRLKYRASIGIQHVGVGSMWFAFAVYNVIRTSLWHLRLAQLQRRTERDVAMAE